MCADFAIELDRIGKFANSLHNGNASSRMMPLGLCEPALPEDARG
jgi:hypothetical protein